MVIQHLNDALSALQVLQFTNNLDPWIKEAVLHVAAALDVARREIVVELAAREREESIKIELLRDLQHRVINLEKKINIQSGVMKNYIHDSWDH